MRSEWKTVVLDEVCEIVRGGSPRPIMDFVTKNSNGINWIKIGDVAQGDKYITHTNEKIIPKGVKSSREVVAGDLILSNSMSFGRPYILQLDGCIHDGWLRLRNNAEVLDREYLYYFLCSKLAQDQFRAVATGSVVNNLKSDTVKAVTLSLPMLSSQIDIVRTLSTLDNKIALNTKINQHLEQMAQAIFKSWFVDFEPWGGVMPHSWREGTISDLGKVIGGSTPSKTKAEYYTEHGIAWVTPKDLSINRSKFIARGADDITELGLRNSSARLMPRGTVLFSSRAPIGYIAIASGEVCTNQGFKSIVPRDNVGTAFVYYFLIENLQVIEGMASGSTFKEVSGSTMKSVPAIIPDDDTLRRFQADCDSIFEKQALLEQESAHLATLRDTLLPRLMSGELAVGDN